MVKFSFPSRRRNTRSLCDWSSDVCSSDLSMKILPPAGGRIFMLQYRTNAGERRKPAIGRFGELTVEQARSIAQDWLADVRKGKDPSAEKTAARDAPSVKDLCPKFIEDYSKPKNRPKTVESNQGYIERHIIPSLG